MVVSLPPGQYFDHEERGNLVKCKQYLEVTLRLSMSNEYDKITEWKPKGVGGKGREIKMIVES